jgi:selenide,water dikinase
VKLAYTLDVITPIVDDPRVFGQIAAANALSDVYAMGGDPQVALSFAGLPEHLGLDVFREVLHGAAEKAVEAGCAVVGGHTIKDTEPKCGLAVIGQIVGAPWTHADANEGDALVLTKKIGTGVVAQAIKKDAAELAWLDGAVAGMTELNRAAKEAGRRHAVTAATDITGFGLLGHLHHMADASGLCAEIELAAVPLLEGARAAAEAGHVPGGSKRNLKYVAPHLEADGVDEVSKLLLADAQTSGGLAMTLPRANAEALVAELDGAVIIGRMVARNEVTLRVV